MFYYKLYCETFVKIFLHTIKFDLKKYHRNFCDIKIVPHSVSKKKNIYIYINNNNSSNNNNNDNNNNNNNKKKKKKI